MKNRYIMDFTQSIDSRKGIKQSKVYLLEYKEDVNFDKVVRRLDLGFASTEEEAYKKVNEYILKQK